MTFSVGPLLRKRNAALLLTLVGAIGAQTPPRIERDIPYAQPRAERQLLDVFAPGVGSKLPVVLWVHGGGWQAGSKEQVDRKPAAFVEKGYVFVPVNYRFVPAVTMEVIVRDVAKAVGWVHANIERFGGDPQRIFLMGHSAGAQLVALLAADSRYIEAEGVPRSALVGCVPVDGDTYDVPLQVATAQARYRSEHKPFPKRGHPEKFGNLRQQRELSAVNHVAANRGIPPFLLLHVDTHTDTTAQAYRLWAALDQAGVPARIFGASDSEHSKLDRELGVPGDASTKVLFEFMAQALAEKR